jgi:hypothetical protein
MNITTMMHDSTLLKETVYNSDDKTLTVTFQNGARYIYKNVDNETYQEFYTVESKGSFFGKNIRKKYEYEKIEEDGVQESI